MKASMLKTVIFLLSVVIVAQVGAQKTTPKPADCGTTRGCFSDCEGSNCGFVVSWTVNGTNAVYTISSSVSTESATWMAVGFSNDTNMEDDDVMGCASNTSGSAVKFSATNPHHSRPTLYTDTETTLTSYSLQNGIHSCTIQRPVSASITNKRVDANTAWTLLFAIGTTSFDQTGQPSISYHGGTNRFWSTVPVKVTDNRDAGATNVLTSNTATTTIMPTGGTTMAPSIGTVIAKPSGCGSSMGCLSDCQSSNCGFVVTWTVSGNNAIYTFATSLVGTSGTWIAVGFSSDSSMGADDVLGCASDANGRVVAFTAQNNPYSPPEYYTDADVRLTTGKVENNVLSCTVQRPIAGAATSRRRDVSQPWTLLTAKGDATVTQAGQASIIKHSGNNRYWSTIAVRVSENRDIVAVNSQTSTQSPAPATGTILKPSGCGSTIGCISNCQGSSCGFIVTWAPSGNEATYTLATNLVDTSGTWIAIGFSSDSDMGDDDLLGCASGASGNVVRFTGKNNRYSQPGYYTDAAVVLVNGKVQDNVLSCTVRRPIAAAANGRRDVSQPWTILLARGVATIASGQAMIQKHLPSNRFIWSQKVNVSEMVDLGASGLEGSLSNKARLIKAHGSLMIISWIFLASIGIVLARYYKPVWSGSMCSEKVWFQLHRICMILVFCATTAGFVMIFVAIDGYSKIEEEGRAFLIGHPIIGIIVMILTVINPVMALFRPHPGAPRRPIFNWGHWFVGTAAHILAVVNVFFGVLLSLSDVPYYLVYILAAYVAWQIFVELLLELLSFFGRKLERSETYEMNSDSGDKTTAAVESSTTILIKRIILIVHCVVVACLSAALIGLFVTGKEGLEKVAKNITDIHAANFPSFTTA